MQILSERMTYSNFYMRPGDKPWSSVMLTDAAKSVIASASVAPNYYRNGRAMIWSVKVEDAWRGKKFGELLMIYTIFEACRRGYTKLSLHVDSQNAVARKLYEKLGFVYESTLPPAREVGQDVYLDEDDPEYNDYYCCDLCSPHKHVWVEMCSVPWQNWLMTMHLDLTPDRIRALKARRRQIRKQVGEL